MSSFLPEVTLRAHRERLTLPSASLLLALGSLSAPGPGLPPDAHRRLSRGSGGAVLSVGRGEGPLPQCSTALRVRQGPRAKAFVETAVLESGHGLSLSPGP